MEKNYLFFVFANEYQALVSVILFFWLSTIISFIVCDFFVVVVVVVVAFDEDDDDKNNRINFAKGSSIKRCNIIAARTDRMMRRKQNCN